MAKLFETFKLRTIEFRNRIGVSPMCQYSAVDGLPQDWHFVHLGSRAVGGAGLVILEATAVEPKGRITLGDLGLWDQTQVAAYARITKFISAQGSIPGLQIAHAGRKASTPLPWTEKSSRTLTDSEGRWDSVGATAESFHPGRYQVPRSLSVNEIHEIQEKFVQTTKLALSAGFKFLEIHAAHGYLLHSFYSPLSNQRADEYGGSFENRTRMILEVSKKVRAAWPDTLPLSVRLSCSDWSQGGWTIDDSVRLAIELKKIGVDIIDASSGGNVPTAEIPVGPGYQVAFAQAIREKAGIATASVGMITDAHQAETIVATGQADMVLLARELLRDPYWPAHAEKLLNQGVTLVPVQYIRAF